MSSRALPGSDRETEQDRLQFVATGVGKARVDWNPKSRTYAYRIICMHPACHSPRARWSTAGKGKVDLPTCLEEWALHMHYKHRELGAPLLENVKEIQKRRREAKKQAEAEFWGQFNLTG